MSFEQIPQERKDAYLANAEQAVREATDPVLAKLGESTVAAAENILGVNEQHGPVAQAETILIADELGKKPLDSTAFENSGLLNDKGYRALAGNYSSLEPTTQNRLFDAGFIDGEGQALRVPENPEDLAQIAHALKASPNLGEQIAANALEHELLRQQNDVVTPEASAKAKASLDRMFGNTEAPNMLTEAEQAKLAELDTTKLHNRG